MKSLFIFTEVLFQGKSWYLKKKKKNHKRLCRLHRREPELTHWMEQLTPAPAAVSCLDTVLSNQ